MAKDLPASVHDSPQNVASWAGGEMRRDRPVGDIMRRLRLGLRSERRRPARAVHQTIAVADARNKLQAADLIEFRRCTGASQFFSDGPNERLAFVAADVARSEVAH